MIVNGTVLAPHTNAPPVIAAIVARAPGVVNSDCRPSPASRTLGNVSDSPIARVVSIQVGLPAVHGTPGTDESSKKPWRTGFYKSPVAGPVWLGQTNLAGDGQADLRVHGGVDKAVLGYAASHYPDWRTELDMPSLPYGAFAENFTITFLHEGNVCLGDVYAVGGARVEVSQPRQPCANITRRWNLPGLTEQVRATGRHGWYMRVLDEGEVVASEPITLLDRPCPDWTIARAFEVMNHRASDRGQAAVLAAVPALSKAWRDQLQAQR
jgi:MOSC domain-containing protein YiiM